MMTPITRIEHYLAKMNGKDVQIPAPITRKELYLAKICGEDVEVPEPVTIDEKFLFALAGGEVNLPKPITRLQNIMAKRLGLQAAEIEPITRQEYFWHGGDEPEPPTPEVWKTVSGAIASFVTSVAYPIRKLVAQINPVQDLHGQLSPWPAGGGKNLCETLVDSITISGVTISSDGSKITFNGTATATISANLADWKKFTRINITTEGTYTRSITNQFPSGCSNVFYDVDGNMIGQITATLPVNGYYFAVYIPSGTVFNNFSTQVQCEAGSTATTFAPFSNECPISGHTGLSGYNDPKYGGFIKWNQIFKGSSGGGHGLTLSLDADRKTVTINGTTDAVTYVRQYDVGLSITGHKYYASLGTTVAGIMFYNDNKGVMAASETPEVVAEATGDTPFYFRFDNGASYSNVSFTPQLCDLTEMFGAGNEPATVEAFKALFPHDYYPYNAGEETTVSAVNGDPYEEFSVSFPSTIYGGSDEVVGGVLTDEYGIADLGDINFSYSAGGGYFYASASALPNCKVFDNNVTPVAWCSCYQIYSASSIGSSTISYGISLPGGSYVRLKDARTSDPATLKTLLAGQKIVYPLATPQTYQLTPQEVSTLLGQNNVWHDANGDIEVEYLESGLPEAYTQVAGFTFNSYCYFEISGLKLRGSDTVMFSMVPRVACNVFGCYTTSDADNNYSLYVSTANNAKYLRYDGSTYKSKFASGDLGKRYDISITPTGSHGFPEGQDDTWTEATFEASTDMCIGTTATNASSAKFKGDIIGTFTVAGRFSGVPCKRNSDNVLGYYDMVSKKFYEPASGTPTVVN